MTYRGYTIKAERLGTKWVATAKHGKSIIISTREASSSKAEADVKVKIDKNLDSDLSLGEALHRFISGATSGCQHPVRAIELRDNGEVFCLDCNELVRTA